MNAISQAFGSLFARLRREDAGATMVEYGVVVALIAVAAIFAISLLGSNTCEAFNDVNTELANNGVGTTPTQQC